MGWVEFLGYAASVAVLATFCMSTMVPLRIAALVSNVLFAIYGYMDNLHPVLILHVILFPVNALRLWQARKLVHDVRNAAGGEFPVAGLMPYMRQRDVPAGTTLMRKGEKADRLYYLAEGELELVEIGKTIGKDAILGEIGVFAHDHERTATVVCRTDCRVYELTEAKARELYFVDRTFGFAVLQLIIHRLLENNHRLLQHGPGPGQPRGAGDD